MLESEHAYDDPLKVADEDELKDEVGLCLSGGGYKAAIFHLGGLIRLNELGLLPKLHRVSSVSGGSITAAVLGLAWTGLGFDKTTGRAANFDKLVRDPLLEFCRTARIDKRAVITGLVTPFLSGSEAVEKAYERLLFKGATLQDLPADGEGPRFVLNATNMQLGSLMRFSRPYAADWRIGMIDQPDFSMAKVVASSSGFPPLFSPAVFELPAGRVRPTKGADRFDEGYVTRLELADGGVYDNLGLETVWKRCRTVLVSNAGNPFDEREDPPDDYWSQLRRTISVIHRQAENHRARFLIALADQGAREAALWSLRSRVSRYANHGPALDDDEARVTGEIDVRLWPLNAREATLLLRHGYSLADAAVRTYWGEAKAAAAPAGLGHLVAS